MTDDVTKAIARMRDQMANGDPDWWRDEELILRHIDGEPARLAAAREEQREACIAIVSRWVGGIVPGLNAVGELRATTLAATPLADEIAALRARVAYLEGELHETIGENADLVVRAERAEAERDALKSRLYGPLTAEEYARLTALESLTETEARQAMASGVSADKLGTFLGRVYKTVGERDARAAELAESLRLANENVVRLAKAHAETVGERDALRAQLLSERERLERWLTAPDGKQYERGTVQAVFDECDALRAQQVDLLDAMDKSKP